MSPATTPWRCAAAVAMLAAAVYWKRPAPSHANGIGPTALDAAQVVAFQSTGVTILRGLLADELSAAGVRAEFDSALARAERSFLRAALVAMGCEDEDDEDDKDASASTPSSPSPDPSAASASAASSSSSARPFDGGAGVVRALEACQAAVAARDGADARPRVPYVQYLNLHRNSSRLCAPISPQRRFGGAGRGGGYALTVATASRRQCETHAAHNAATSAPFLCVSHAATSSRPRLSLATSPALGAAAATLLNVRAVRLYQTAGFVKVRRMRTWCTGRMRIERTHLSSSFEPKRTRVAGE